MVTCFLPWRIRHSTGSYSEASHDFVQYCRMSNSPAMGCTRGPLSADDTRREASSMRSSSCMLGLQ